MDAAVPSSQAVGATATAAVDPLEGAARAATTAGAVSPGGITTACPEASQGSVVAAAMQPVVEELKVSSSGGARPACLRRGPDSRVPGAGKHSLGGLDAAACCDSGLCHGPLQELVCTMHSTQAELVSAVRSTQAELVRVVQIEAEELRAAVAAAAIQQHNAIAAAHNTWAFEGREPKDNVSLMPIKNSSGKAPQGERIYVSVTTLRASTWTHPLACHSLCAQDLH